MQNTQRCINCLLPDTRNTTYLYKEKKSPVYIIITAGLGVPMSTG